MRCLPKTFALAALVLAAGCGGRPPPPRRAVMEANIGSWQFRRYQKLLDVEVWVPDNKGVAHAASYTRSAAEKRNSLQDDDIVNAFVTRYEHNNGILRQLVRFARRLAQESGYVVEEHKLGGVRLLLVKGHGEAWALWAAPRHVVKVGGRGRDSVPPGVVKAYAERYPSRVTAGILDGPLPPGQDEPKKEKRDPDDDFDTGPTPDWDKFKKGAPGKK